MAQQPPQGPKAPAVTRDTIKSLVTIDLNDSYAGLQSETARLLTEYVTRGLSGDALADAVANDLKALSTADIERAGRESTHKGFVLGRNLEAQARPEDIGEVVRTAVLDENTCTEQDYGDGYPRCRELDGRTFDFNSPDYFEFMPPSHCEGGGQCRCIPLYRAA